MPQQVTVRVEIGPYVLREREVEFLEVRQAVGEHMRCELAFLRDPKAVDSGVAALRLGELADAVVRVIFVADGSDEYLAFAGRVREAEVDHLPTGAGHVSVLAFSDSHVLGEHVDRQYLPNQTVPSLAARFGVRVAGAVPAGAARDYMQTGVSAWAFLAQVAAEEGLQLRAVWPRTPDGPAAESAELGGGFTDQTHALTWGRELMRFSTGLSPVNAGVTGAFYDPAEKHDHRFRGVRASVGWLGGAGPVVTAAKDVLTRDADGGDPGYLEPGRVAGVRARTLAEFRDRLELESGRRAGAAVRAQGASVVPALRAGDRIDVAASPTFSLDGADPELADRTGVFGLTSVTHRWTGTLYENVFAATPWADYHAVPAPAASGTVHRDGALAGDASSGGDATYALAVVVDDADPSGRGRIKVRYAFMAGEETTHWARLTGLGGGNARGLGALPTIGDEVIVAVVGGDPEHPVVVGALWNGVDGAGHAPGRQHWVTASGNALAFLEGEGAKGGTTPTVELHTREAKTWMQLTQRGPTGVPTVTLHSEGDLSLEAPNGQLRVTAKRYVAHVADEHATMAEGTHTVKSGGALTVESAAAVAMKAASDVALRAGAALRSHAGGSHTLTGSQVLANPPGATAPAVQARVPAAPPSAWGPRPVPAPGPGRSTEDPRTPTRGELAAKAATAPAWLELAYTHGDDGSPMAGAPYRVRFADGSTRAGTLDARGRARLDGLAPALAGTAVDVRYGEPSAAFRPLPVAAAPNPDYRPTALAVLTTPPDGPTYADAGGGGDGAPRLMFASYTPGAARGAGVAGGAARHGVAGAVRRAPDGPVGEVLEYLWSLVAGAYAKEPTSGEIVGQMVVAMIPVVGQIADVRDLSAYVYQLSKPDLAGEARRAAWIGLVLTGVALALPEVGAAVAGVGRLALRGGPEAERLALPLLRRVGRGNALKFLERELSAAQIEAHATAALARVSGYLREFFAAVERTWLPVSAAVRRAAGQALADLGRVVKEAQQAVKGVADEIAAKAKPLLAKIERDGERAAGQTNSKVEQQAGAEAAGRPPEPEGPGKSPKERRAAKQRAAQEAERERILRERMGEADRKGAYNKLSDSDRAWIEADPRRKELAFDPDTGAYKLDEARAALRAEEQGLVPRPVRRALPGGGDILDGIDREWDVKDLREGIEKIAAKVNGGENILVDARGLSQAERDALDQSIRSRLGPEAAHVAVAGAH